MRPCRVAATWTGLLLAICAHQLVGCQRDGESALDAEEQRWVKMEDTVPPTGGPVSSAPAPARPAPMPTQPVAPAAPVTSAAPPLMSPEASVAEQVKVTIYPSTIITCDGALEVDYEHAKATFHENVHVTDERGELFADVMDVFFTPSHEISQVHASGHVRIVRGDDTAYSDEAVYLQKEGKVFLTGQPKLVLFPETTQQAAGSQR